MRFFVKNSDRDSAYVIPCSDPSASVKKLKEDVVVRIRGEEASSGNCRLILSGSEAILSDKDIISDVLRDGDFITLSCKYNLASYISCRRHLLYYCSWLTRSPFCLRCRYYISQICRHSAVLTRVIIFLVNTVI